MYTGHGTHIFLDYAYNRLSQTTQDVEGRLNRGVFGRLSTGDELRLCGGDDLAQVGSGKPPKQLRTAVCAVRRYPSFSEYLLGEGLRRTLPGVSSLAEGIAAYRRFYSEQEEQAHGVVAVELRLLEEESKGKPVG